MKTSSRSELAAMTETIEDGKLSKCSSKNPFDPQTSDRDHFPSFEAALADDQSTEKEEKNEMAEKDDGSAVNWSIDTLAELKPMDFSPPTFQQENARNTLETSLGTSNFFEDEKQYQVLWTPVPVIRSLKTKAAATNRSRKILTTSPSMPMELHRRQRMTTAPCAAGLQESQHTMDKLLLPQTPKRSPRQRTTSSSRSTSPWPAKRNSHSNAMTSDNEWESPSVGRPKWSTSPITTLCTTPTALPLDAITPSPLVNASGKKTPKQRSRLRLSFGLSPIAMPFSQ